MKKWLLAMLPLALFTGKSFGQCTPDPAHTSELVYPLPSNISYMATEGEYFEEVITLNIPEDTSVVIGGFPINAIIDSAVVSTVAGFPNGVSHECNPSGCVFPGNTSGCLKISGTPTESGTFQVTPTIIVFYSAGGIGSSLTIDTLSYSIDVNPAGIEDFANGKGVRLIQNPVVNNLKVELFSNGNSKVVTKIYNLIGELVYSTDNAIVSGVNTLDFNTANLASGNYILVIENNGEVISEKFNKQ